MHGTDFVLAPQGKPMRLYDRNAHFFHETCKLLYRKRDALNSISREFDPESIKLIEGDKSPAFAPLLPLSLCHFLKRCGFNSAKFCGF